MLRGACYLRPSSCLLVVSVLLSACTATIDESSLLPRLKEPKVVNVADPLPGYVREDRLLDLPGLGQVHVARLTRRENKTTLIYSGGNGFFVSSSGAGLNRLASITGADIVTFDYAGRGGTTVPNTVGALIAFGPALVAALREIGWLRGGPLYSYGFSLGGATASNIAGAGHFDGLVLESTAADIPAVALNMVPTLLKPFVRLNIAAQLKQFDYAGYAIAARAPILILACEDDRVIDVQLTRRLAADLRVAGANVTLVEVTGGHGSALASGAARDALGSFMRY